MAGSFWMFVTIFCVIKDAECLLYGQDASIDEFPFVVAFVDDIDNQPYCNGILQRIDENDSSSNIVMTTANCMCRKDGKDYALNHLTAFLGGLYEPTTVTRKLLDLECMPDFDPRQPGSEVHDFAVVLLSSPVEFTDHIRGIDGPTEFSVTPGSECFMASYGPIELTANGPDIFPEKLQKIKMTYVEGINGECGSQVQTSNGTLFCGKISTWPNRTAPGRTVPGDEGCAVVCRIDGRLVLSGIQHSGAVKVVESVVFDSKDEL